LQLHDWLLARAAHFHAQTTISKTCALTAIELPASLRSEGVRVHTGIAFGFPPEWVFSFAGNPQSDAEFANTFWTIREKHRAGLLVAKVSAITLKSTKTHEPFAKSREVARAHLYRTFCKNEAKTVGDQESSCLHTKATASNLPYKHTRHGCVCIGERPIPHGRVVVVPIGPPPSDMRFLHSGGIRLPIRGLGLDAACGVREC
jgi:hypothetical protein